MPEAIECLGRALRVVTQRFRLNWTSGRSLLHIICAWASELDWNFRLRTSSHASTFWLNGYWRGQGLEVSRRCSRAHAKATLELLDLVLLLPAGFLLFFFPIGIDSRHGVMCRAS